MLLFLPIPAHGAGCAGRNCAIETSKAAETRCMADELVAVVTGEARGIGLAVRRHR